MEIPEWQVHEYNPNLYLLRQSPCTDFEKPFIFLFFGKDKALLMDTGSRNGNLAPTLRRTVKNWLARNGRESIPLIVVHSHPHDDHIAGDAEVQAMHDPAIPVEFVSADLEPTKRFWGIEHWPTDIAHVDLGGRVIDMVPIPGHSAVSVALYDRNTALLLAGDSLYPGRLYVRDFAAFQTSTERLVRFTEGKPVAHILGNHIEQTSTPFLDYPVGTMYQPNEHELRFHDTGREEKIRAASNPREAEDVGPHASVGTWPRGHARRARAPFSDEYSYEDPGESFKRGGMDIGANSARGELLADAGRG